MGVGVYKYQGDAEEHSHFQVLLDSLDSQPAYEDALAMAGVESEAEERPPELVSRGCYADFLTRQESDALNALAGGAAKLIEASLKQAYAEGPRGAYSVRNPVQCRFVPAENRVARDDLQVLAEASVDITWELDLCARDWEHHTVLVLLPSESTTRILDEADFLLNPEHPLRDRVSEEAIAEERADFEDEHGMTPEAFTEGYEAYFAAAEQGLKAALTQDSYFAKRVRTSGYTTGLMDMSEWPRPQDIPAPESCSEDPAPSP